MLNHVKGIITERTDQLLVIECGGIGFAVQVPNAALWPITLEHMVYLYLHWNAEQGPSLFGFQSVQERQVFLLIISCSGIGPRIALALLAQLSPSSFVQAIAAQDLKLLSSVPGIGPKKAEHIAVQLRHKVTALLTQGAFAQQDYASHWKDVSGVLESLHYSKSEVSRVLQHLTETGKTNLPLDELLRHALSFLSKRV
jgi:Holliday junction DNA helicase RuvA